MMQRTSESEHILWVVRKYPFAPKTKVDQNEQNREYEIENNEKSR